MREITFFNVPDFDQTVTLERRAYTINLKWNTRSESWYMSISDGNGNVLLSGIKLVSSYSKHSIYPLGIIRKYSVEGIPKGEFFVVDNYESGTTPKRDSFVSGSFSLVYFERSEIGHA